MYVFILKEFLYSISIFCANSESSQVLPLGLYRAPQKSEGAYMPFVYTCPSPTTILNLGDKVYVYGSPKDIKAVFQQLALPFTKQNGATILGLACCLHQYYYSNNLVSLLGFVDNAKRRRSAAAGGGGGSAILVAASAAAAAAGP
jgi:hypothetical protein